MNALVVVLAGNIGIYTNKQNGSYDLSSEVHIIVGLWSFLSFRYSEKK